MRLSTEVRHVIRANRLPCAETIAYLANACSVVFEAIPMSDQLIFLV